MTAQEPYQHEPVKQGLLLVADSVGICASDRWWRQSKQAHLNRIDDCVNSDISNDIVTMVRSFLARIDNDLLSNSSQTPSESIFQSNCGLYSSVNTIDIDIVELVKKYPPSKGIEGYSLDTTPIYNSTVVEFLTPRSLKPNARDRRTKSLKETAVLDQRRLLLRKALCIQPRTCRSHAKCRLCAMDGLSNRRPSCPFFKS
jgi:hypothetical protein